MSAAAQNIPTFKLVLGRHIVASYLAMLVSHYFSLNFLIDNAHSVLDGLVPHLLAFLPRTSPETPLGCVQLATVEQAKPPSSR